VSDTSEKALDEEAKYLLGFTKSMLKKYNM